jgi:CubicO group peptidase (beta-lactamase class C family)
MLLANSIFLFVFLSFSAFAEFTPLEKQLETIRAAYIIPGMSAAIYVDGKAVEHAVSGIRKVGTAELISQEDKFHLGSCTKSMTATLTALFVEEGRITWKSTLEELLPLYQIHSDFKKITIEKLLAHRSGLTRDPSDELHVKLEKLEPKVGREELAKVFLAQKPEFTTDEFNYSNIGYILVGHILEALSGKSWETLMQEKIFKPLAMDTCGFGPTSIEGEEHPSEPWGHILMDYTVMPVHDDNAPFYGPSANVHCSIKDWVKYLTVHINGYNQESNFLKQENFDQLHTLAPISKGEEYTYGGWYRLQRVWANGDVLMHTGTNTYNFASVWMAPKTKTILVSTANRSRYSGGWATSEAISAMIRLFINMD